MKVKVFDEAHEKDLAKAETYFLTAIEQREYFPEAYYDVGLVYWQQGKLDKAKEYIQKAVEQDPDNKDYQSVLDELGSF